MRHAGKIVLVTGAAQGIGLACAERFHAEGARIVMVDLGEDHLRAAAEGLGERAAVVRADLSAITAKDAAAIVGRAVELFGGLDVLVNNAGVIHIDDFVDFRRTPSIASSGSTSGRRFSSGRQRRAL